MKTFIYYSIIGFSFIGTICVYPLTKSPELAVSCFLGMLTFYVAIYTIIDSKKQSNFDFLNSVLIDIETDLKSVDFSTAYEFNNSNSTEMFNEFMRLRSYIKELNGMNFIEVYYAYWELINNNTNYQYDQHNKLAPTTFDYMRYVENLESHLFMKLLYSNKEIIEVINKIDEYRFPNLQKKYLYRKIRRISFDYCHLLERKGVAVGYASLKNPATNYEFDIPYFKSVDTTESKKFIHTSLFKENKFDELYKVLISKKVMEIGLSISEQHSKDYYK